MLYAHDDPKQTLAEHLLGVLQWGEHLRQQAKNHILQRLPDQLFRVFLVLHDIGKATAYFQRYLLNKTEEGELKNHAEFSAVFFLAYQIMVGISSRDEIFVSAMFYSILRHHGDLQNIKDAYQFRIDEEVSRRLLKQWESIDQDELKDLASHIELDCWEAFLSKPFAEHFICVQKFLKEQKRKFRGAEHDEKAYYITQMLFSLLVDADKSQAGLRNLELVSRPRYHADILQFIKAKNASPTALNHMRMQALHEAAESVSNPYSIMTLTLPTGLGKTLTSFHAAMRLKEQLKKDTGKEYRIIYVMPFMSIIDQNAEVFEELLLSQNEKVSQNLILKHHHLAELVWKTKDAEMLENQSAKLLIEGWNSEIVVTTFHQFFLTLIGYKNAMQRKFNKLSNAIVLIDEIQAIPVKYYKLIGKMLEWYVEAMDSKVIAMTATQPHLFSPESSKELCDARKYFQRLCRTKIINDFRRKQTVEEFAEALVCHEEKSYLMIVNTIACGVQLHGRLQRKYPTEKILFLSTLMTPKSRRKAIKKIKKGEYRIVVSTQLVEAGVDIDFDVVYRDFAPLPSIFQSAGRSNREGDPHKIGLVYIITLVNRNKRYCDQVYRNSAVDLDITEKVLKVDCYGEAEFMDVIQEYFKYISSEEVKSQAESDALLQGIKKQLYDNDHSERSTSEIAPVSRFALIEDDYAKLPVFIEEDDEAIELWQQYQRLSSMHNSSWEDRAELQRISRKMADYVINVSDFVFQKYNKPPLDINGLYYYVAKDELHRYYEDEMGYGVISDTYFY